MKGPQRRFRVSYRSSLALVVPLLVVATGLVIAVRSYMSSKEAVEGLAVRLFEEAAEHTATRTRAHVARAIPAADLLAQTLADGEIARDTDSLARHFLRVLRANPGFTWVSYSESDGRFTGAFRPANGPLRVNQSVIVDGRTELVEHEVDAGGQWTERLRANDTGYDPRKRPFYELAQRARRRVWTPPYLFFDPVVPGITCATPDFAPDGGLRGVLTIDFDLDALSEFVATLRFSPHGAVLLVTLNGELLAYPNMGNRGRARADAAGDDADTSANGALVRVASMSDPVASAMFASLDPSSLAVRRQQTRFAVGGVPYLASATPFVVDGDVRWIVAAFAPESDFLATVDQNNISSLAISSLALVLALALALLIAARISAPLVSLAREMDRVGRFDLDDRPMPRTIFRELAEMTDALRRMKAGLASFGSYVPRDLVRRLLSSGKEAKLGVDTRILTIFFSDLGGFASLSERLPPAEVVELLSAYLEDMTAAITASGGTVDKYLGDGIMAFWGAPETDEKHAEHACEAALLCQRKLDALAATEGGKWLRTAPTRIGVATGDVVVGNIGTRERMNYTVMGDTANLAARLEALNKQYGTRLMIAEATYLDAHCAIIARPVDVVAVKGKARGTRVYEVLARADDTAAASASALADATRVAFDAYLARDFTRAVELYARVLDLAPSDPVATRMGARAAMLASSPPGQDWGGVFVATEK